MAVSVKTVIMFEAVIRADTRKTFDFCKSLTEARDKTNNNNFLISKKSLFFLTLKSVFKGLERN